MRGCNVGVTSLYVRRIYAGTNVKLAPLISLTLSSYPTENIVPLDVDAKEVTRLE
jgi:hypothetical protein